MTEPCGGTLNIPSARKHLEAFDLVRAFDDVDSPLADANEGRSQLVASVVAVGKDVAQPGKPRTDGAQHINGAIASQ